MSEKQKLLDSLDRLNELALEVYGPGGDRQGEIDVGMFNLEICRVRCLLGECDSECRRLIEAAEDSDDDDWDGHDDVHEVNKDGNDSAREEILSRYVNGD